MKYTARAIYCCIKRNDIVIAVYLSKKRAKKAGPEGPYFTQYSYVHGEVWKKGRKESPNSVKGVQFAGILPNRSTHFILVHPQEILAAFQSI